jgi:pimeloyl-ACP methyl ester carboxylesterase
MSFLRCNAWLAVLAFVAASARAGYVPAPGACDVGTFEATWHDAGRNRDVPVKIYYPTGPQAPQSSPVIVFSHGLGGSRQGYAYLGEAWAAHGYISVHPQHAGSDEAVFRSERRPLRKVAALKHAANDPENLVNRPRDVTFVIDQLTALNGDSAFVLHGRMDLHHLAVAGHSFGAYTTMALAGQAIGSGAHARYFGPDPRIVAGVAMSSQPAALDAVEHAYDRVHIPVLHLTGTNDESMAGRAAAVDDSPLGRTTAAGRRVAYDHTRNAPAYLVTFKDGDHMLFSGRDSTEISPLRSLLGGTVVSDLPETTREAMRRQVVDATVAFWDATLRDNAGAREWLEDGAFVAALGSLGTFEQKYPIAAAAPN